MEIGVIFDMDGVLVDSQRPHLESWRVAAAELGHNISLEQFQATFGRTSGDIIRALFGISDAATVRRIDERKEAIYRDLVRADVPIMAGARELIGALSKAGARLAVGSSGPPENVELICEAMRMDGALSVRVTGRDVQRGKPDPQIFQLAAARMHIEPRRCVVIEDAPVGIQAAARAGMKCVALVGTHPAASLAGANRVVQSLSEISPSTIRLLVSS